MRPGDHITKPVKGDTLSLQANTGALFTFPSREEIDKKMRCRHQDPKPRKHGNYWTIVVWKDEFQNAQFAVIRCDIVSRHSKPNGARFSDSKTNTYNR